MKRTLVLGGPGTGKTTRMIRVVEQAIRSGVSPERIAFVAYTKAAALEAQTRTSHALNLPTKAMPYFRTLHSLCFRELGLSRAQVLTKEYLVELGDIVGEQLTGELADDSPPRRLGDLLLTLDFYSRSTMRSLEEAHDEAEQEVDWFRLKRFVDAYKVFRDDRGLLDYTDMLERYVEHGLPVPVDIAIVDEGQDLSRLQWAVVQRAFPGVKELWVAGDDDQSIYVWSGADTAHFLSLPYEREILPVSYRLPEAIFAFGQEIIANVENRFLKPVRSGRAGGVVNWVSHLDEVDFSEGSWLLLARTRAQLSFLEESLRSQGVIYKMRHTSSVDPAHIRAIEAHEQLRKGWRIEGTEVVYALRAANKRTLGIDESKTFTAEELKYDASVIWHDALTAIPIEDREYYLACRRRGEHLHEEPRIRIETIHGSKGAEAEHVLMVTDLTYRVQRGYERNPDSEHKVFYVGATRARETLTLLSPQSAYGYRI